MRVEGQRLTAQLKACFAEIERLEVLYCQVIERLETYVLPNLSLQSAAQWFRMYLRAVDLGVQIRRGEIRHRTAQHISYQCMHKTGIKGAVHSGLSIDDGNAIYQLLESQKLVKESRLDGWFIKIDGLDRDKIGSLDKRVTACLEIFCRQKSAFYDRIEVTGEDPHEEMLVLGGPTSRVLVKVKRTCFEPTNCSCVDDAQPWEDFNLTSNVPQKVVPASIDSNVESVQEDEVGIIDIKRQMGFEQLSHDEEIKALSSDVVEFTRLQKDCGPKSAALGSLRMAPSARSIYQKKCEEIGSKPKPLMNAMLAVTKGAHFLNLSRVGFHSADDLKDLVYIFSKPGLPPVKELDFSNGFFNAPAFQILCQLLQLPLIRSRVERLSFRGIAVPQSADIAVLLQLLAGDSSKPESLPALDALKTLDLSFTTLQRESVACLPTLLASLRGLENLSLESCFPEPASAFDMAVCSSDQKTTEENVRVALVEVSNRLRCLNFSSNCIIESRWLDALFTPGNTFQELNLHGITSCSNHAPDTMDFVRQEGEIWSLQQVETLKWSSNSMYTNTLLEALSVELRGGFSQLKHLDLKVNISTQLDDKDQAERKLATVISCIADHAVLKSCRICCYSRNVAISHSAFESLKKLLERGLQECEVLTLCIPQLHVDPTAICDLLSRAVVSKMRKMTLGIGIAHRGEIVPSLTSDLSQLQSLQEMTLGFYVADERQSTADAAAVALARELEASWLGLSSFSGNLVQVEKRDAGHATEKANRSFELSEYLRSNQRFYQCRFLTTTPR